jgi:hypothetical protein
MSFSAAGLYGSKWSTTRRRARLWELADRVFPVYASYREKAARVGRTIPILQLVPR